NAQGLATIAVTSTGQYDVIRVAGVDATGLPEGSEAGREFQKENPLTDPYPNLLYTFTGSISVVSVSFLGRHYSLCVTVPGINKVRVLKVGTAVSDDGGNAAVSAGTEAFAGRVIFLNLNFSDTQGGIRITSSDANDNRMLLYPNLTAGNPAPEILETAFYGGPSSTRTETGLVASYTQAGPIYFEAPGTAQGDWALGHNGTVTDLKTRDDFGGADQTRNFPSFNGGATVLSTWKLAGSDPAAYRFDYRIFQFEAF
ncbi:MAG: hypothetical protein R6W75_02860, partial [Smithellaceae bacterium]